MYCIPRHGTRSQGLSEEYSWAFPHSGMKFRHISKALCCRVWLSLIWHRTHIPFNCQFWQAATHYYHILPLPGMPLNDSFCSVEANCLPTGILWICACQHTTRVIIQTRNFQVQARLIPLVLSWYLNLCLIGMWRPPLQCHTCHAPCQPILWRKVSITRLP